MKAQGSADVASRIPLGPEDRAILALECATVAGHTCKVMRLGPNGPSLAALRERIAARIHLTPALLRRLSDNLTAPAWEAGPDFDLARHVVEHRHQRPVSPEGLLTCVARLFEQRLDRSRPLWQMDVIELEQDERALVADPPLPRRRHDLGPLRPGAALGRFPRADNDPGADCGPTRLRRGSPATSSGGLPAPRVQALSRSLPVRWLGWVLPRRGICHCTTVCPYTTPPRR
jgi:hypothetical protein